MTPSDVENRSDFCAVDAVSSRSTAFFVALGTVVALKWEVGEADDDERADFFDGVRAGSVA